LSRGFWICSEREADTCSRSGRRRQCARRSGGGRGFRTRLRRSSIREPFVARNVAAVHTNDGGGFAIRNQCRARRVELRADENVTVALGRPSLGVLTPTGRRVFIRDLNLVWVAAHLPRRNAFARGSTPESANDHEPAQDCEFFADHVSLLARTVSRFKIRKCEAKLGRGETRCDHPKSTRSAPPSRLGRGFY